ncbi:MAG TPA: hypothetical protein PKK23_11305 [Nitrospirales bacterium]|nr:hypothetical protein [Nitrospiraceae bacterium]HNP29625.1 hypothetical protein [Nitrospirales bacterium]
MNGHFLKSLYYLHRNTSASWDNAEVSRNFFLTLWCSLSLTTLVEAHELKIDIVNSWVEDGYIFHINFQVSPYNLNCPTTGAGFLGFNVLYKDPKSSQSDWTFGLAPWPDGPASDPKVWSHLTAYGPQGFCTSFSPCTIQDVQMVKAWCPPSGAETYHAE